MAKRKRKTWWEKHWDEVVLWGSLIAGSLLILSSIGAI